MATQVADNSGTIDTSRYEFVQGKLVERAVPGFTHSSIQERMTQFIREQVAGTGKIVRAEFSLDKTDSPGSEWLTPDVLVSTVAGFNLKSNNQHALPPAFLAIEVLSAGQTFMNMRWKADQYLNWGVEHVWLLDPESTSVLTFNALDRGRAQLISQGLVSIEGQISFTLTSIFE